MKTYQPSDLQYKRTFDVINHRRYLKVKKAVVIALVLAFISNFLGWGFWGALFTIVFTLSEKRPIFQNNRKIDGILLGNSTYYYSYPIGGRSDLKSSPFGSGILDNLNIGKFIYHDIMYDKRTKITTKLDKDNHIELTKEQLKDFRLCADREYLKACLTDYKFKAQAYLEYFILRLLGRFKFRKNEVLCR